MSYLKWSRSGSEAGQDGLPKWSLEALAEVYVFSKGLLKSVVEGRVERITNAFSWGTTPQGYAHWRDIHIGEQPLSPEDLNFLQQLLDYLNRGGGGDDWVYLDEEEEEEDDW